MKVKDLVYMITDELKLYSDDSVFTEDHIIFLLSKYRAFILKQRYADIKKEIPQSNYQTLCLDLEEIGSIDNEPCGGGSYLKSKTKIPNTLTISNNKVYPMNYYLGSIAFISKERMKYVGYNKYLQNILYCSLGPDGYLYLKSNNPQFLYLEKVKFTGIFEDLEKAFENQCPDENGETICDIMNSDFPLEEALVPPVLEMVMKELAGPSWRPEDDTNNASDDLSSLANFIARNMKSNLQKKIEE